MRNWAGASWLAVGAVCVGAFMGQLDASIVTVALPALQRVFQAGIGAVTWVGLSYLLVLVATVTAVGRFAGPGCHRTPGMRSAASCSIRINARSGALPAASLKLTRITRHRPSSPRGYAGRHATSGSR